MIRETFVTGISSLSNRADLVKENRSPDVTILHVVKAIVTASDEAIDSPWVSDFTVLTPVSRELKLGLLGVAVLAKTVQVDQERHVATVSSEKSHALEVSLGERSALHYYSKQKLLRT